MSATDWIVLVGFGLCAVVLIWDARYVERRDEDDDVYGDVSYFPSAAARAGRRSDVGRLATRATRRRSELASLQRGQVVDLAADPRVRR